jgi:hypothetical protein
MAIGLTGFLILPILIMVVGSFKTEQGWSIANYLNTIQGEYIKSFFNTLVSDLIGNGCGRWGIGNLDGDRSGLGAVSVEFFTNADQCGG